jgi:hypothetical protein
MNKHYEATLKIGQIIAAGELVKMCKGVNYLSPEAERALKAAQQSLLDAQVLIEKVLED